MSSRPPNPEDNVVLIDSDKSSDDEQYKPPPPKSSNGNSRRDDAGNIRWPKSEREVKPRTFYGNSRPIHTYSRKGRTRLHVPPSSQRRGNKKLEDIETSYAEQGSYKQTQEKSIYDLPSEYENEEEDEPTLKREPRQRVAKTKAQAKFDFKGKGKATENKMILSSDEDDTVIGTRITRSRNWLRKSSPKKIPDPIPCPFCWSRFIKKESFLFVERFEVHVKICHRKVDPQGAEYRRCKAEISALKFDRKHYEDLQAIARMERNRKIWKQMLERGNKFRDEELKKNPQAFDWIRTLAAPSAKRTPPAIPASSNDQISLDTIGHKSRTPTQKPESEIWVEYGTWVQGPVSEIRLGDDKNVEQIQQAGRVGKMAFQTVENDDNLYALPSEKAVKTDGASHDTSAVNPVEEEDPDETLYRLFMAEDGRIAALARKAAQNPRTSSFTGVSASLSGAMHNGITKDSRAGKRLVPRINARTHGVPTHRIYRDINAWAYHSHPSAPELNPDDAPGSPTKRGMNSPESGVTPTKRQRMEEAPIPSFSKATELDHNMTNGDIAGDASENYSTLAQPDIDDYMNDKDSTDNGQGAFDGKEEFDASADSSLSKNDHNEHDEHDEHDEEMKVDHSE